MRELIVFPLLVAAFTGVASAQTNELPRIAAADATNYMGTQVVVTGKLGVLLVLRRIDGCAIRRPRTRECFLATTHRQT